MLSVQSSSSESITDKSMNQTNAGSIWNMSSITSMVTDRLTTRANGPTFLLSSSETVTLTTTTAADPGNTALFAFITAVVFTAAVWIMVSNALIIAAPFVYGPLRKKAFLLVSSLALTDLLKAIFIPTAWVMFYVDFVQKGRPIKSLYCSTRLALVLAPCLATMLHVFLLACDRYIAMVHRTRYHAYRLRNLTKFLCLFSWFLSFVVASLIFMWNRCEDENWDQTMGMEPIYAHLAVGATFWLLMAVTLIIYFQIYKFASPGYPQRNMTAQQKNKWIAETRTTKLAFISLAAYLVCWLPFILAVHLLVARVARPVALIPVSLLAYANAGVNFGVFFARSLKYKHAFKKMWCCESEEEEN